MTNETQKLKRFPCRRLVLNGIKLLVFFGLAAPNVWAGPAVVVQMKGEVERRLPDSQDWAALQIGDRLPEGTAIHTGEQSSIDLDLDQGHHIRVAADSAFVLAALQTNKTKMFLNKGKILSQVRGLKEYEKFLIQTPSAVCAVRGTEFWTGTTDAGTVVKVNHGTVGMMGNTGHDEVMVHAGQTASILHDGSVIPPHAPGSQSSGPAPQSPLAKEARHEVGLDMTRSEVMAAAAAEIRVAEYREGKSMIDAQGDRVRLEEYIVRPAANQFKFVVLNERDQRLDYFFYGGTFNKDLPTDLSTALRQLPGAFGSTAPDYYLTAYETGQSNTIDNTHDIGTGGHLVNITIDSNGDYVLTDSADPLNTRTVPAAQLESNNITYEVYNPVTDTFTQGVAAADVAAATRLGMYIPETQVFQDLAPGDTFWKTRFNSYNHSVNGITKINYLQSGASNVLANDLDMTQTFAGGFKLSVTTVDPLSYDVTTTVTYGDGTFETYRSLLIDNEGHTAALTTFDGITTGPEFKNELMKWNYEQQTTASEFEGRKIDLVVEPKIFIESGLIP
jgi:hypothetical protein